MLLNDRTLRETMGARGKEIAERELSVEASSQKLFDIIEAISHDRLKTLGVTVLGQVRFFLECYFNSSSFLSIKEPILTIS